jgi:hypothetical protein
LDGKTYPFAWDGAASKIRVNNILFADGYNQNVLVSKSIAHQVSSLMIPDGWGSSAPAPEAVGTIHQLLEKLPSGKSYTLNKILAVANSYPEWNQTAVNVTIIVPTDAVNTMNGTRPGLISK